MKRFIFIIILQFVFSLTIEAQPLQRISRDIWFYNINRSGEYFPVKVVVNIHISVNPLNDVLNVLFMGLTDTERQQGIISAIPENTKILSIQTRGDTSYINLSEDFVYNTLGILGYEMQMEQLLRTVSNFQNIRNVQIMIEGRRVDFLGNSNVRIDRPFPIPENITALTIERTIQEQERFSVGIRNNNLFTINERSINDIQGIITEKTMPIGNNVYLIKKIQNNVSQYFIKAEHSGTFLRYIDEIQIRIDDQLFTLKDNEPTINTLINIYFEAATIQLPDNAVNLLRSCNTVFTQINGRSKGQPSIVSDQGIEYIRLFFHD